MGATVIDHHDARRIGQVKDRKLMVAKGDKRAAVGPTTRERNDLDERHIA